MNFTGKDKTLAPVHPNASIESAYRKQLDRILKAMHGNIRQEIAETYPTNPGERSAFTAVIQRMRQLSDRWQDRFDRLAPKLAEHFTKAAAERSDAGLKSALRKAGFTVRFQVTPEVENVLSASLAENVSLIKSIGQQHLTEVEGLVMRSAMAGRDLGTLTDELAERYQITRKRAAFIARDQNNKATAVLTRARQQELGITQARWVHSSGGKHPRPSHVKAGREGLVYNVAEGALIDGERIWPGQLPNCRCVARSIVPGFS